MTRATRALLDGTPARALDGALTALAGVEPAAMVCAVEFEPATAESIREVGIRPLLEALVARRDIGALRALVDSAAAGLVDDEEHGEGADPTNEFAHLALSIVARLRAVEHWTSVIVWRESWS